MGRGNLKIELNNKRKCANFKMKFMLTLNDDRCVTGPLHLGEEIKIITIGRTTYHLSRKLSLRIKISFK